MKFDDPKEIEKLRETYIEFYNKIEANSFKL